MISYIKSLLIMILAAAPFYMAPRAIWLCNRKKKYGCAFQAGREAALCLFVLFISGLLALALRGNYSAPQVMLKDAADRINTGEGIQFIPFASIISFFGAFHSDTFLVNIAGNILMFVPWGLGLTLFWKKNRSAARFLLLCALLPLLIESCQLFIGRLVDIDDWILNFTGGCLGALLSFPMRRIIPGIKKWEMPA